MRYLVSDASMPMNERLRFLLYNLIGTEGKALSTDAKRIKALLLDFCRGECRSDINVLTSAVEERVTERLLTGSEHHPIGILIEQQAKCLRDDRGMTDEIAHAVVKTWAQVLGLIPFSSINETDSAEMVLIPAGDFIMGSIDGPADQRPQHCVCLDRYLIYKYPVTVAQYRLFCERSSHQMPDKPSWGWKDNHPIVNTTWNDARAYAEWSGAQLPTEAQWEKAARGSIPQRYPWGDEWCVDRCVNRNNSQSTQPIDMFSNGVSPFGVMGMAGNVWEWCEDWYSNKYYRQIDAPNPQGPTAGFSRVLRGGSWMNGGNDDASLIFACTYRQQLPPTQTWPDSCGFRCIVIYR